jgi:hypothetical protein
MALVVGPQAYDFRCTCCGWASGWFVVVDQQHVRRVASIDATKEPEGRTSTGGV